MPTPPEALRVMLQDRIRDADQAFALGHHLYRFELFSGSIAIGVSTLACIAMATWVTSLGEARGTGIAAVLVIAAIGVVALAWLWMRVRRWSDALGATTQADLERAYAAYIAEMERN